MAEVQLLAAIAEIIRQGGLLALVVIEGWIIYKLYTSRDKLYDRLIEAKEDDRDRSDRMTGRVVSALERSTLVAERIEQKKYGAISAHEHLALPSADEDAEFEDEDEDEEEAG